MIHFNRYLSFTFDDMKVRNQITLLIQNEARSQPARRPNLHHRFAELIHLIADRALSGARPRPLKELSFAFRRRGWQGLARFAALGWGFARPAIRGRASVLASHLIGNNLCDLAFGNRQDRVANIYNKQVLLLGYDLEADGCLLAQL